MNPLLVREDSENVSIASIPPGVLSNALTHLCGIMWDRNGDRRIIPHEVLANAYDSVQGARAMVEREIINEIPTGLYLIWWGETVPLSAADSEIRLEKHG